MFDLTKAPTRNVVRQTQGKINPMVTIVQRGSQRIAFLVTSIALQAGTFPSRYVGKVGTEVKSVQLVTYGKPIANFKMSGKPLVEDELAELRNFATANDIQTVEGEDQIAFIGDLQVERGSRNVANGEGLVTVHWQQDAIPTNTVKNATTQRAETSMSGEVLGSLKDLGSKVITLAVQDEEWQPFLTESGTEENGWLRTRDFTPKADATEQTSVAAEQAAKAGVSAPTDAKDAADGL
jgi:hypothetical protein